MLCSWHCIQHFTYIILFILTKFYEVLEKLFSYFVDEETEAQIG